MLRQGRSSTTEMHDSLNFVFFFYLFKTFPNNADDNNAPSSTEHFAATFVAAAGFTHSHSFMKMSPRQPTKSSQRQEEDSAALHIKVRRTSLYYSRNKKYVSDVLSHNKKKRAQNFELLFSSSGFFFIHFCSTLLCFLLDAAENIVTQAMS